MTMKKKWKSTILTAALAMLLVAGCGGDKDDTGKQDEKKVAVKGQIVTVSDSRLTRNFTGTIEGAQQAVMTAKISEAVEDVMVREGDFVKSDDILVRLDHTGPTSSYMQSKSLYQNAEKNYNKMKYLYNEGAVSETEFDAAKTEYEVSLANFDAARQMVDIKSPIDGMVTSVDVSSGDYLYPGQVVATVASIDRLRMKLGVSSADINLFHAGEKVDVYVESASRLEAEGEIDKVARSADPATRSFAVEIAIDNNGRDLKPGMFGRAAITTRSLENIVAVPRSAVMAAAEGNYAFVVENGVARRRSVVLGVDFEGMIQIESGLNTGDTLVTIGQNYLADSVSVNLVRLVDENGEEIEL